MVGSLYSFPNNTCSNSLVLNGRLLFLDDRSPAPALPFLHLTSFNSNPLSLCPAQKHLGLVLDLKLTFNEHISHILSKFNKSIGLLRKFQPVLPRSSLLTIYKTFIRSHFNYADVIYDYSYKSSFHEKLESIQYNAALAVTGTVRGSFSEKFYQDLVLESL